MLGLDLWHLKLFHIELNLMAQIITVFLLLVSLFCKKKGKIRLHGTTMGIAVVLHAVSFVLVMGPSFFQAFEFFSSETSVLGVQTTWLHAVPGAIALILGIFLVVKWIVRASNVAPCYKRKRIMDATLLLWLVSLAFGIATYVLFYL